MKLMKYRAFTLVELMISLVIVALLAGVIFQTYRTIFDITIRVENEKIVANELLFAHQTIQNLVDNYTIDFPAYGYKIPNFGQTGVLLFTGRGSGSPYQGSYKIFLQNGAIVMQRGSAGAIPLTDSGVVTVSGLQFTILPYSTTGARNDGTTIPIGAIHFERVSDIYHPSFWMHGTMYIRNYRTDKYVWSVKQPIQSFFNIRAY